MLSTLAHNSLARCSTRAQPPLLFHIPFFIPPSSKTPTVHSKRVVRTCITLRALTPPWTSFFPVDVGVQDIERGFLITGLSFDEGRRGGERERERVSSSLRRNNGRVYAVGCQQPTLLYTQVCTGQENAYVCTRGVGAVITSNKSR